MKNNFRFFSTVIALLLAAIFILTGCIYAISESKGDPKTYDMNIVSETVAEQGGAVIDNSPASQSDLQKKFSEMYEISESGKTITVISEEYLENYWRDIQNSGKSRALTTGEVLYIIQDSVRIYFEYDKYIIFANSPYLHAHQKMVMRTIVPDGILTAYPLGKALMENNYSSVCVDIHRIILYRLAALSTPDAFIFADEAIQSVGGDPATYNGMYPASVFYIPSDAPVSDAEALTDFIGDGNATDELKEQVRIFNIRSFGAERVEFLTDGFSVTVFPTTEMEATQANRVVNITDRTVTENIPTDQAMELFCENEKFEYYFPSMRSEYVIATMYDGRQMLLTEALEKGYIAPYDLDSFDFEYIRKVKHEPNNGEIYEYPFSGFLLQAVYTDKLRADGIFPYANLINSAEELRNYTEEIKENNVYVTDRGTDGIPSYDEWVTKYTEKWFADNSLIIVVAETDSDVLPSIDLAQIEPNHRIDLYLDEESLGSKSDQVYTIFFEIHKVEAEIINIFYD